VSRPLDGGRHAWLGFLQPTGLVVAPAALARLGLWPEPPGPGERAAVAAALPAFAAGDPWPFCRDVLGWPADRVLGLPGGVPVPADYTRSLRDGETLLEPHWAIAAADGQGVQLLLRIEGDDAPLDRRGALDGWEATPHQRFERLLRETGVVAGVLVGHRETGRRDGAALEPVLRLVVAPRGEAAGHATWPVAALAEVAGRGMLAGLKLLLDAHALFTGAPSHRLPAVLAASREAQTEVSAKLAGQVLASLHELLRGLDAAAPALIRDLAARDPHQLYEGLLTVLLRLIFILYAEDRRLLPSDAGGGAAALYEQGYALGGLHVRLLDDQALHPDVMDERRGAWGRLLALFRLVDRGHPSGFMQARGGKLFSEETFPFLLGRRAPNDAETVLPVGDGCVLRVLDALLTLDGERVEYSALSVEQIGSVYETVMGFTVEVAAAPTLAIRAGKNNRVPVWVDLAALAAVPPAERLGWLKARTGRGQFPAAVAAALRRAGSAPALEAALAPVVDRRACPGGAAVPPGTPVLQPTDERRRTGSHYTPRSLTAPIVTHALAPAFARLGADAMPADVLDLRVCDPACGSGAFLVEACRQLGERLVAAWERWPAQRPTIPADETALLHAKRLVASHCLRGVDRNPLALDLAKLSLWLETLAVSRPFGFLDHVLRAGDSLVGLPNPKIMAVTWGKTVAQHSFVESIVRDGIRAAAEIGRVIRAEAEIAAYDVQAGRHREALVARTRAHLVADAVLEAFFDGANAKAREANLAEVQRLVLAPGRDSWPELVALQRRLRASPIGITSFHWELEFEDVFTRANPGFDAIVGNPPFAGKNTIASGHTLAYPEWLKTLHPGAHGNADLAAHFFRRAFALLRRGGAFGLIATNTIRQGDTRETGLARIVADGGVIYRAVSRHRWEGEAAVVVAQVFVRKGEAPAPAAPRTIPASGDAPPDSTRHPGLEPGSSLPSPSAGGDGTAGLPDMAVLDGKPVRRISAYLLEGDLDRSPNVLRQNQNQAFQGSILLGMGFTFDDVNAGKGTATSLADMYALLAQEPHLREVILPYLGGEEVNNSPTQSHHRFVMNLSHLPEADARDRYGSLMRIVEQKVRPARMQLPPTSAWNRDVAARWWQFGADRKGIAAIARAKPELLVHSCGATPHVAFARVSSAACFANTLAVFALSSDAAFAVLQSRVHEVWARFFASSMKDDLRYTPTDCFETFPLPEDYEDDVGLRHAGGQYLAHRAALMVARGEGMTPTYNRFHRAADTADDIAELRELHRLMDDAVLRAYGWDDLARRAFADFLDAESEDDHRYRRRLFWPAPFRDELLGRLLRLNEDRAAAERRL
jgi:hypothetical protein